MVYAFITSTRNKGLEILLSRVFHVILLFLSYRYIVHSWGWMGFGKGGGGGGWMSQRTVNTSMQFRQGMTFSVYKESSNT